MRLYFQDFFDVEQWLRRLELFDVLGFLHKHFDLAGCEPYDQKQLL